MPPAQLHLADRFPDGAASEIIGGTITSLFRDGRIRNGVLAGLDDPPAAQA